LGNCTSTAIYTLAVHQIPDVSVVNDTICIGQTGTVTATGCSTYTWTYGYNVTDTGSTIVASPTVSAGYWVTGTDSYGCVSNPTYGQIIIGNPSFYVGNGNNGYDYNPDTVKICTAFSNTLTAYGASSYTWMPGGVTTNTLVAANTPTIYTLTEINDRNCPSATYTFVTTVNQPVTISYSPYNSICAGTLDTLMINQTGTYTIAPAATATANPWYQNSFLLGPNATTTYTITGNQGGCSAMPTVVTVTVNLAPVVSFTVIPDAAPHAWSVYPTYPSNVWYAYWTWGDGNYSFDSYPNHTYASAGTYSICVFVSDSNRCSTTYCQDDSVSGYINVIQPQTTGINQRADINNQATIYPNPTSTNFVIETTSTDKQTLQVFDVNGKLVLTQTINSKTNIDASNLPEGVYNLSLQNANGVTNKRLVIVR
jgi:hypothetical protein